MLSILLASVLVQQTTPEPKLEWSTFGDFAAKQFEGSEYRLVMDRAIGERPMVYYFSNPGTDKLALLKRTCKELCLNFEVDEKLKKIFIAGPNSDAGLTLRAKLQIGIQKMQEIARANWSKSTTKLNNEANRLLQLSMDQIPAKERELLMFERSVLVSLVRPESRAVMSCLLSIDAGSLATRMAQSQSGEGALPVTGEARNILANAFKGAPPSDKDELMWWTEIKKIYDEMVVDGAVPTITYSVAKSGAASIFLRLDGKTKSRALGAVSISTYGWLDDPDESKDFVPDSLAKEEFNPKQTIFWGVEGMNIFQTLAIKHKWNTVAWLDVGRNHPEYTKTLEGFNKLKKVRVKLTDDGWMVPYLYGQRYPEFTGNWRGVMKMEGKIEPETDIKKLREYLESLTFEEINGMAEIEGEMFDYRLTSLLSSARLIRTALRISEATKLKEFDLKLSQVDLNIGGEISHYWPYVVNEQLKTPALVQMRGLAHIGMLDRELADPDFDELPTARTLIVILAVPSGKFVEGKEVFVQEMCSVVLKKEK
ncbi:MAG: hypothetical protein KF824_13170 [Fimbriimonadaceae bacterium]|nr:MAG: hypothetical protein KF824_13170 [Fimbriimonadaceae bacterium]